MPVPTRSASGQFKVHGAEGSDHHEYGWIPLHRLQEQAKSLPVLEPVLCLDETIIVGSAWPEIVPFQLRPFRMWCYQARRLYYVSMQSARCMNKGGATDMSCPVPDVPAICKDRDTCTSSAASVGKLFLKVRPALTRRSGWLLEGNQCRPSQTCMAQGPRHFRDIMIYANEAACDLVVRSTQAGWMLSLIQTESMALITHMSESLSLPLQQCCPFSWPHFNSYGCNYVAKMAQGQVVGVC